MLQHSKKRNNHLGVNTFCSTSYLPVCQPKNPHKSDFGLKHWMLTRLQSDTPSFTVFSFIWTFLNTVPF